MQWTTPPACKRRLRAAPGRSDNAPEIPGHRGSSRGANIVDPEGVYDTRVSNDRLLLGLKGTLSTYRLTLLQQRALSAIWEKAAQDLGDKGPLARAAV
jgi:hypothetical protein